MKTLIAQISRIADRFAVTKNRTEQRNLISSFISIATAAINHPECPPEYRNWLGEILPQFKSDLLRITEIDMMCDN